MRNFLQHQVLFNSCLIVKEFIKLYGEKQNIAQQGLFFNNKSLFK